MRGKYGPLWLHQLGGSQQLHGQLDWSLTLKGDLIQIQSDLIGSSNFQGGDSKWISNIKPKNLPAIASVRWERFAPGRVRTITVNKAKAKAEPKARGRKRKSPPDDICDPEVHDGVFDSKSTHGIAVPPEPPSEIEGLGGSNQVLPAESDATPIPTRATFAGRVRKGSVQHELDFDARRTKFYEWVPSSFWKDHFEREFWNKCVESENLEVAIKSFLMDIGFDPSKIQPRSVTAAKVPKSTAQPKVAAGKAKAKATPADKPKSQGRGRARGRGRGRGNAAVCRV